MKLPEKLHHSEVGESYARSESSSFDIIETVNAIIDFLDEQFEEFKMCHCERTSYYKRRDSSYKRHTYHQCWSEKADEQSSKEESIVGEKHTHVRHWHEETKEWKCPCEETEAPQAQEKVCCENCNGSKNQSSSVSSVCSGNCSCHKEKEEDDGEKDCCCCQRGTSERWMGCKCNCHRILNDTTWDDDIHKEPVSERNEVKEVNGLVKHAGMWHYKECKFPTVDEAVCNCPGNLRPKNNVSERNGDEKYSYFNNETLEEWKERHSYGCKCEPPANLKESSERNEEKECGCYGIITCKKHAQKMPHGCSKCGIHSKADKCDCSCHTEPLIVPTGGDSKVSERNAPIDELVEGVEAYVSSWDFPKKYIDKAESKADYDCGLYGGMETFIDFLKSKKK